jgi:hypothetical protein
MSFFNSTRYAALDVPMPDHEGRDVVVAIVKAAFEILPSGKVVKAAEPAKIRVNHECYDPDEPMSSIKLPSDVCTEKHGTDVVVVGDAVSTTPVTVMDVAVKVRGVTVPLRVHGERVFYQGPFKVTIGPAAPFKRKPIVYENAYGGLADKGRIVEARNQSGVGVAKRSKDLIGQPAPQIEHPSRPHTTVGDDHPPVGFGAIWGHWEPRLSHAGTFDQVWMETRMPNMPLDWDVRANNVAHPSLIFDPPLAAGDEIAALGMTERGLLSFQIPRFPVVIRARFDESGKTEVRPPIDTVVILPEKGWLELTMRKAFPIGRAKDVLREIRVEDDA